MDERLYQIIRKKRVNPHTLTEVRLRLDLARTIALTFNGATRTYISGSIAQSTYVHPLTDGDGGVVLDRHVYPNFDPEASRTSPYEITKALCGVLGREIRQVYPKARCGTSKRGPKIWFRQAVAGRDDPTIDLVVAFDRSSGSGLWIPNLEENTWERSAPEQHVAIFAAGPQVQQRLHRQVVRLLKAWNKQFAHPAFSSHHLTVWAWKYLEPRSTLTNGLLSVIAAASKELESGNQTKDPAGVSPDLRPLIPTRIAIKRLNRALLDIIRAREDEETGTHVSGSLRAMYFKDF
jgi:hypothetical protein